MGPTVNRPYPRRLENLTICRGHYKQRLHFLPGYLKDPKCWSGRRFEPEVAQNSGN